jgi:CubicO group peptidase (beta-lactamase class C family)
MRAQLDAFRRRHDIPAIGGALVDLDGRTHVDVVGVTRRGSSDTVTADDSWHIGSCGKAITAALYARLVEHGLAAWGTPVRELFPDLAGEIHRAWSTPTIDELLTCRAGVRPNPTRSQLRAAYHDLTAPVVQRSEAVRSALSGPPEHHGRFRYSNLGYVLVGAAIERVTRLSFEEALTQWILEPLGVTSAGFGPPRTVCGHRSRLQLGGLCVGRGDPASPDDLQSDNPALLSPAGRLHLTVTDWARVQRLFLDGAGLLDQASVQRILDLPGDGRRMGMGWASAARLPNAELGMQGSNTCWSAAALIRADRQRIAMVVTNDGRTRVLTATASLAASVLSLTHA